MDVRAGREAWELLEREAELARLQDLIESAASGHGAVIVVEGAAGIGKTSLLTEALRLASEPDLKPLVARGGELERDFAYGVVRQLFEVPLARMPQAQRDSLLHGAAGLVAPLLDVGGPTEQAAVGLLGEDPTAAVLHGLYWLTANLAALHPVILAVDDAHWADVASLRYLSYLARRAQELPVLLVVATRPPAESHAPDLLRNLCLDPAVLRLEPAPLSARAVAALVRERCGSPAHSDLAEACHAATRGNPFLVRALLSGIGSMTAASELPEASNQAIASAVAQRLARLGPAADALARAVAVLGTDAEPRQAYRLAGLGAPAGASAEHALIGAEVLAPRRPLEFVHPIVRAAVAQLFTPPERAARHLDAARLLSADGSDAERVAPHLLAGDARADAWVVQTLRQAAARSLERGAPEAGVRYLRRALDEPPPAEQRALVLGELGRAEVRAALPDDAVAHLREALALTEDARTKALMTQDLALGLIAPGRYEEAVAMLEEAAEAVGDSDPELSRGLQAELLCGARLDPRTLPVARSLYERLPVPVEAATPGERMLLATIAMERTMRGGAAADAASLAARALEGGLIDEQSGDSGLVLDAGFALGVAGDFGRAERLWSEALADVRRRGSVIGFARCSTLRAMLRINQGSLLEAESDARNAIDAAWEPGYRVARMAHAPLVEALVDQGQPEAAQDALVAGGFDGAIPDTFMLNFVLFARARLRLATGAHQAAIGDLEDLGRRERKWRDRNPAVFPYRSLLAFAIRDDRERAIALANEELALARAWGTAGPIGRALRTLALVQGEADTVELLGQSLAVLDGSEWRLERARTLIELGAAMRRAGRRREAREPLQAGMELAHRCNAAALTSRAREELLATGARPRRIVRTGLDSLTASERRVARMAASGMTNREIAQALFVTTRTVEVHLTHVYQKLDIGARSELAGMFETGD